MQNSHSINIKEPHSVNMKKNYKKGQEEIKKKSTSQRMGQVTQSQGINLKASGNSASSSQLGKNSARSEIYSRKGK